MININKVLLAGNLTSDPVLSHTTTQTPVVNFRLANNTKIGDKTKVCFIDCAAFGKQAELVMQYCSKGSSVLVDARLDEDQWTTDSGDKRFKHYLTVSQVTFLSFNKDKTADEADI